MPEEAYVTALLADLDEELPGRFDRRLVSIFFGGGTPSLFSPAAFERLLEAFEQRIGFTDDIEITLEANPGTFEQEKFRTYRQLGINRLSIGIQSFQTEKLRALGRIHNGEDAIRAVKSARQAGFDNLNLDLMHGLPEQMPTDALSDLQQAISLGPSHLSWYQLTLEPNTVFSRHPPQLPEEELLWAIQETGQNLLISKGFRHYETSAYALDDRYARHNLNYWRFGDYLGIGAGAHGKLTTPDGRILRRWKTRSPKDYLAKGARFTTGEQTLSNEEIPFEFMMNALRLLDGVPRSLFSQRTFLPLESIEVILRKAVEMGLLADDPERLRPTARGQMFLNELLQLFLS